ncbi:HAD family hydrolase [Streptomyces sp. NPDC001027]|uniref:HAD family hydrolase n=1 Tax=Streptomyces sp. NPDC001027 TaxID=3154771 RepID=UPI00332875C2
MRPEEIPGWISHALPAPDRTVVWLLDVDDTLTDTRAMHHDAAESLASELSGSMTTSLAASVARRFREVFDELLVLHQQASTADRAALNSVKELESRVRGHQVDIRERWGTTRLFSREILLRVAVEDCGASLPPEELNRCVDRYWDHMREHPLVFPDAARFSRRLASRSMPVYLMTSSDARYHECDNGQFSYDPRVSRRDKRKRMVNLRDHGISYASSFIGDPIDKPSKDFYEFVFSGISRDLDTPLQSLSIVVVGDSYRSDIQTPLELRDSSVGVLCRREQSAVRVEADRVLSVGDFDMLTRMLDVIEGEDRG